MELNKNIESAEIFASNGCTSGCKEQCKAEQRPTSESNGSTKVKGSISSN